MFKNCSTFDSKTLWNYHDKITNLHNIDISYRKIYIFKMLC